MTFNKPTKIRSKKIRQSAKGQACTLRTPHCNSNPETVVFCHAPSRYKGTGTKSDDFWGAYGCSGCHSWIDNEGTTTQAIGYWMHAIYETQKKLVNKGLIGVS